LSHRHPYGAICVPGDPIVTDRITVIAADENLGPQLGVVSGRAFRWVLALSPWK
jgi:hypothetical protein